MPHQERLEQSDETRRLQTRAANAVRDRQVSEERPAAAELTRRALHLEDGKGGSFSVLDWGFISPDGGLYVGSSEPVHAHVDYIKLLDERGKLPEGRKETPGELEALVELIRDFGWIRWRGRSAYSATSENTLIIRLSRSPSSAAILNCQRLARQFVTVGCTRVQVERGESPEKMVGPVAEFVERGIEGLAGPA